MNTPAKQKWFVSLLLAVTGALALLSPGAAPAQAVGYRGPWPRGISASDQTRLAASLRRCEGQLEGFHRRRPSERRLPDAEWFYKAAVWALRFEPQFSAADLTLVFRALERAESRLGALVQGNASWADKAGRVARGFRSDVDGSVQGYGLIVPAGYRRARSRPWRLDVVLHGSTRPVGMSELRMVMPFDMGDTVGEPGPDVDYLELRPVGRVENGYRWAGETDIYEAIEAVAREYSIDRDRIVLRGMSMGASGTWHLGLKRPDQFVALGPYCGYVDTHRFSESPIANFVRIGRLPDHQERMLSLLDSVNYAANAGVVPAVAAMGDQDPFFQAHVIMGEAMRAEGLRMANLIAPGTGHVQDPRTHAEQMRRIGEYVRTGIDRAPPRIRFVTWSLRYSRCHWLELLGLNEHYRRAEITARLAGDGSVVVETLANVTRFAILPPGLQEAEARLEVLGKEMELPPVSARTGGVVVVRTGQGWKVAESKNGVRLSGKRPGLQGPIDDVFTCPFLCVRGTGMPWNPQVTAWADASLRRFEDEWSRYFRGDLRVKDDRALTRADLRDYHLVLFGDPGSNPWIRRALPGLPLEWERDRLTIAGKTYGARDHAPLLVAPNPLPGSEGRYVVINSGHTFHAAELGSLNYLLFPRLGDWAVARVGGGAPGVSGSDQEFAATGFFDERWRGAR